MKKYIYIIIVSYIYASFNICVHAQGEAEQMLVFRNTGEVNLLYSSQVDSIVCSIFDKDSVVHDKYVSQVFYTSDTILVVPISEIDSVTFGSRNIVDFKPGIRHFSESDISYIIRYDGNYVYYRTGTPSNILPKVGEKLFYSEMTEVFPNGLCAEVLSVEKTAQEIKVNVSSVELSEIFNKLFFAGKVQPEQTPHVRDFKTRSIHNLEIPCSMDIPDVGNIGVKVGAEIEAEFVVNPLQDYYYAVFDMDTNLSMSIKLHVVDAKEICIEPDFRIIHFPNIAVVFHPQLTLGAFLNLQAELSYSYSMQRHYKNKWEWVRHNGEVTFVNHGALDKVEPEDKAQSDVTCKGSLFLGPKFTFELNTLLASAGTRVKTKIGPVIESEVGLGLVQSLAQKYSPELYAKGELSVASKLGLSVSAFTRNIFLDKETEHEILSYSHIWGKTTYDLFPKFESTRAVELNQNAEVTTISAATKSGNGIVRDVEVGFQVENVNTDEAMRTVFVDTLVSEQEQMQGFFTEQMVPAMAYNPEQTIVRPIFRYADYTLKADKARILSDKNFQPIISLLADGVNNMTSGCPFVNSVTIDSTCYIVGNHLPIVVRDTVYNSASSFVYGEYILPEEALSLVGTWKGDLDGEEIYLTFNKDLTGKYIQNEEIGFSYKLNYPQSGDVYLEMNDAIVKKFVLYSLTKEEMILMIKSKGVYITFTKQ